MTAQIGLALGQEDKGLEAVHARPACISFQGPGQTSSQLQAHRLHTGGLKVAKVGVFTPQGLAEAAGLPVHHRFTWLRQKVGCPGTMHILPAWLVPMEDAALQHPTGPSHSPSSIQFPLLDRPPAA
jgi:hypothetical protein